MKNVNIDQQSLCTIYEELCNYFGDKNPERIRNFLIQGKLESYINYPVYILDNKCVLPSCFWEYLPFDVFSKKIQRLEENEEFSVNGYIFFDDEKAKLDTVKDTIVSRDLTVMDQGYIDLVAAADDIGSLSNPLSDDVCIQLIQMYSDWYSALEYTGHNDNHHISLYEVYVDNKKYKDFKRKTLGLDASNAKKKIGRPSKDPQWAFIYKSLLKFYYRSNETPKIISAKQQSEILHELLKEEFSSLRQGELLTLKTIENSLGRLK